MPSRGQIASQKDVFRVRRATRGGLWPTGVSPVGYPPPPPASPRLAQAVCPPHIGLKLGKGDNNAVS